MDVSSTDGGNGQSLSLDSNSPSYSDQEAPRWSGLVRRYYPLSEELYFLVHGVECMGHSEQ